MKKDITNNFSSSNNTQNQNQENYSSLKYHSKYSNRYKPEIKESNSVRHYSLKFGGQTPKQYSK